MENRMLSKIEEHVNSSDWFYTLPIVGGVKSYRQRKEIIEEVKKPCRLDKFKLVTYSVMDEACKIASIGLIINGLINSNTSSLIYGVAGYPIFSFQETY